MITDAAYRILATLQSTASLRQLRDRNLYVYQHGAKFVVDLEEPLYPVGSTTVARWSVRKLKQP